MNKRLFVSTLAVVNKSNITIGRGHRRMLEAQMREAKDQRCQDALHLTPTCARVPPPRQRRAEMHTATRHRHIRSHHTALVLVINAPTSARQAGSPLIHNPSDPFHAILPCHVMCSFEPTSSGITASNLQNPPVYRSYAHDAFQAPAPRATHVWNHGHMGSGLVGMRNRQAQDVG